MKHSGFICYFFVPANLFMASSLRRTLVRLEILLSFYLCFANWSTL